MRMIICDRCGELVSQAIKISAELVITKKNIDPWTVGFIPGEYCQACADEISTFISGWKRVKKNDKG